MANNIIVGPNFGSSKVSLTFPNSNFTSDNTDSVIAVDDSGNFISNDPSKTINALTNLAINKGLQINSKIVRDLTTIFAPPSATGGGAPVPENIVFGQLAQATNDGAGTMSYTTGGGPAGGTATKKLTVSGGGMVDMKFLPTLTDSNAVALVLDDVNDGNVKWGDTVDTASNVTPLCSVYQYTGVMKANVGVAYGNTGTTDLGSATAGDIVRMTLSGNDVIVSRSTDNGTTFTNLHTFTGILAGKTDIFVKGIFAVPTTGNKVLNARIYGGV